MVEALKSTSLGFSDLEKVSQDVFMTPEEFDYITTEHLVSVKFFELSKPALERGRKGDIMPDEKMTIDATGKIVVRPEYSIILGLQLSREDRGLAFLELLDVIRRNEDIKKNGNKIFTYTEEVRRIEWVEQESYNFYHSNQDMVDVFLDRSRKVWST